MLTEKHSKQAGTHEIVLALTTLRARMGLTQRDLARMLGVTQGAVGAWETGRAKPSPMALMAIGREAGIGERDWWFAQAGEGYLLVNQTVEAYKARYLVSEAENRTIFLHPNAGPGPNRFVASKAEGKLSLPRSWFRDSQRVYALRARGHSMHPLIPEGFIVLVNIHDNEDLDTLNGNMVACREESGGAVKWLREIGGSFYLESNRRDPEYSPVKVRRGDYQIVGKVISWIGSPQHP